MTNILQAFEPFSQLPDHARKAVANYQQRATSEALIERIADQIVAEHGLAERTWEHPDERHDVLATLVGESAKAHGLDECQREYLGDLLDEWSN